jgi:type VI secretion system protein ImpH
MRATQRCHQTSVIQRLLAAPWRFDLVQALRLIERWQRHNGRARDDDVLPHVRFQNSLSMSFPASQIEALTATGTEPITSSTALQAALDNGDLKMITVTPAFLGFFGVNGMMPSFYTDDIVDQIGRDKYEGTRAFFDIFYNRTMALYFQAACKHRVQHRFDEDGAAAVLPMQLALAGRKASTRDDDAIAHYAALLRHRAVSADLIESVLADYFELPIRVEQFVSRYDRLGNGERCLLGVQSATLGEGAVLGERVHERHTRARVHIGPLSIADYENFLPGAPGAAALNQLLALFATPTIRFELRLILRAVDIPTLGFDAPYGNRLGYDTCLVSGAVPDDCGEFICNLDR